VCREAGSGPGWGGRGKEGEPERKGDGKAKEMGKQRSGNIVSSGKGTGSSTKRVRSGREVQGRL